MNEEELKKIEKQIKAERTDTYFIRLGLFVLAGFICATICYIVCKLIDENVKIGILFGLCFPWGYWITRIITDGIHENFQELYELLALMTFGISIIVFFALKLLLAVVVGMIAMPLLILYYTINILIEEFTDYSKEAKMRLDSKKNTYTAGFNKKTYSVVNKYLNDNGYNLDEEVNSEEDLEEDYEEEILCERCFKKISMKEYEIYDGMCEDCYDDVIINHFD